MRIHDHDVYRVQWGREVCVYVDIVGWVVGFGLRLVTVAAEYMSRILCTHCV